MMMDVVVAVVVVATTISPPPDDNAVAMAGTHWQETEGAKLTGNKGDGAF